MPLSTLVPILHHLLAFSPAHDRSYRQRFFTLTTSETERTLDVFVQNILAMSRENVQVRFLLVLHLNYCWTDAVGLRLI